MNFEAKIQSKARAPPRNYSPTEVRILAGAEVRAGAEVCNLAGAGSEAGVGYLTETEAGAEFRVSEVA